MDFDLPEELSMLQSTVRDFVDAEVAPVAGKFDETEEFPAELVAKAGELGLLGVTIPEQYGGSEMGSLASSIIVEELSRGCASIGVTVSVHNSLVGTPLTNYGVDAARDKYLPGMASGECIGAYALSEAVSGTDAAALQCKGEKSDGGWVLNGAKLWITTGPQAGVFIVFARTSPPENGKPARGISAFLVPQGATGLSIGKKEQKLGIRASHTVEVLLDGVEVPDDHLLGEEGRGFNIAMATLDGGRIGIASQALGIAQASLEAAVAYGKDREQFGRRIADFQSIKWKLAEMSARLDAARMMTRQAAWLKDQGRRCTKEAATAKLLASTLANFAAEEAVQIHGSAGYSREYPVERYFRDARITEIYEGTTEVQRLVIAREVLA